MNALHYDFKRWLRAQGCWVSATSSTANSASRGPITHVFLDGGKAAAPPALRAGALVDAYAAHVSCAAMPLHAVERTVGGGTYRFFADFDVRDDSVPIAEVVRAALACLPDALVGRSVVVCTRGWLDGKTGAHLVWGDARVGDAQATAIRDAWVRRLAEASASGRDGAWWDAVVDASVYRRNGLRMPWSVKKPGDSAVAAYAPTHVSPDGSPSGMRAIEPAPRPSDGAETIAAWIRRTSIMACGPDEVGADAHPFGPVDVDVDLDVEAAPKKEHAKKKTTRANDKANVGDKTNVGGGGNAKGGGCSCFLLSVADRDALLAALPGVYRDSQIGQSCRRTAADGPLLVSCTSRHCLVAGREHSANHVYFELATDGAVWQRCHSTPCVSKRAAIRCIVDHGVDLDSYPAPPQAAKTRRKQKEKRPVGSLFPSAPGASAKFWLHRVTQHSAPAPSHDDCAEEGSADIV